MNFEGKVAVVTGAGNGLGRAHALALAKRGAKVVVNDFGVSLDGSAPSSEAADRVVAEIKALGGTAVANAGSVTSDADVAALVEQTLGAFGRLDILINNAGVLRDKSFAKMEMADFEFVVNVHLLGTARVTRAFWPVMKSQGYGRVVLTTSAAGMFGNFGQTNYGAAKLGIIGLMQTLRIEGGKDNIHTNTIAPIASTRMSETASSKTAEKAAAMSADLVSPGVLALASDDAPNGIVLCAGGGAFSIFKMVETDGIFVGRDNLTPEAVGGALSKLLTNKNFHEANLATEHAQRLLALGGAEL